MIALDQAADRDRPQIDELDVGACLQNRDRRRAKRYGESRGAVEEAEKRHLGRIAETPRLCRLEQRIMAAPGFFQRHPLPPDHIPPPSPALAQCPPPSAP